MNNYILDTPALLWFLRDDENLSDDVRKIIFDKTAMKHVSIASMWEISIKNRIGKLPLKNGISEIFEKIEASGFGLLKINRNCIEAYNKLPLHHRDPFDGIIIATAISEQMTIITADEDILKYDVRCFW